MEMPFLVSLANLCLSQLKRQEEVMRARQWVRLMTCSPHVLSQPSIQSSPLQLLENWSTNRPTSSGQVIRWCLSYVWEFVNHLTYMQLELSSLLVSSPPWYHQLITGIINCSYNTCSYNFILKVFTSFPTALTANDRNRRIQVYQASDG